MAEQGAQGEKATFTLIITEAGELNIELGKAFSDNDIPLLIAAERAVAAVLEPVRLFREC